MDKKEVVELDLLEIKSVKKQSKNSYVLKVAAFSLGGLALLASAVRASGENASEIENSAYVLSTAQRIDSSSDFDLSTTTTVVDYYSDTTIPVETTSPTTTEPVIETTIPVETTSPTTTEPVIETTIPVETTTTIVYKYQDVYGDVCVPLGWTNCAVYQIFNEAGELRNQVISNSDWTLDYIAEASGGGVNGTAVKIRDILPCPPEECESYVG